jgi:hypothetical protein
LAVTEGPKQPRDRTSTKFVCGPNGARKNDVRNCWFKAGTFLTVTRWVGRLYIEPMTPQCSTEPGVGAVIGVPVSCAVTRSEAVLPNVEGGVVDADNVSLRIDATTNIHHLRRAVEVPAVLVPAHVLKPHGRPGEL